MTLDTQIVFFSIDEALERYTRRDYSARCPCCVQMSMDCSCDEGDYGLARRTIRGDISEVRAHGTCATDENTKILLRARWYELKARQQLLEKAGY